MPPRVGRPPSLKLPATPLPAEPVTKAAFARLLGCGKARVTEWTAKRTLAPPAITAGGMVLPRAAAEQLLAAGAVLPAGNAAPAPLDDAARQMTYDEARTATETLKAHHALADLQERRGDLVSRALADGVLFDAGRAMRDGWLNWPARVAAVMASRLKVDPALLLAELDREVKIQLSAVADPVADWRQRAKAARGGI